MNRTPMRLSMFLVPLALSACTIQGADDLQPDHLSDIAQAICPPPTVTQHAMCVCENLDHVGDLFVSPGPGGTGAVGVNGKTDLVGRAEVAGDFIAWGGFRAVGASIGDSLITPAGVSSTGDLQITGDATIGGDLTCIGRVEIGGALALGGDEQVLGGMTIANRTAYTAPAAPPCDCDPATFFDVEAAVAAAQQATGGQTSWDHVGRSEITLTTGNYYVTSANVVGLTTIRVDGAASVFVDGSLSSVGATQWQLAPGATLDLFVSGSVGTVGQLIAGNPADPTAFRLYIGGSNNATVGAIGQSELYGSIYAPRAILNYVGDARIVGSIFARSVHGVGALNIEYGNGGQAPTSCEPTPPGDGGGDEGDGDGEPIFL